jgi:pilus assembly protein CpaC
MSAEPAVARVQPASPTSLFLMGVAPGHTTVIATTQEGSAIVQYDVTVTPGAGGAVAPGAPPAAAGGVSPATARAIQATIAQMVQGASGVRVRAAGNEVILSGTVSNAAAAEKAEAIARAYVGEKGGVVDNLTVLGAIQVNVRVRFAEINRAITRNLGINWQALGTIGSIGKLPAVTLNLPGTISGITGAPAAAACAAGLALSVQCQGVNFNGIIDALVQDQLATILAEPNLTALSGETASFLAGGEFPVPIAGNAYGGQTTITVEYKAFGVSLALVPTVLSPTQLNLRVRPEVSQLSPNGAVSLPVGTGTVTIPALTVRRAETTIELGSGQSFAIAGLLQKTSVDNTNALPYIGEVPVLGALFKSNAFQRGESELVIIVTPYIVQPASNPSALRTPIDAFRPATDLDRILFGRQLAPPLGGGPLDAGFILK